MSKRTKVILMTAAYLMLFGCTRVPPGYVGIKVNYSGSNRGVEDFPSMTGWVWYNPFTATVLEWPTFVQTAVWTRAEEEGSPTNEEISFNSKEGLIITGDISLSYQLRPEKVPHFYVKFRSDNLYMFTHGFLRNMARDLFNEVAGTYSVEDIYGPKKEEFLVRVREKLNVSLKGIGIEIEQFGFIGAPRPPQGVINALNAKVAATQNAMKAENELRQAEAEAKKMVAKAQGEAEANRILSESINDKLVQWRQLEITEKAVARWDGRRPTVEGQGSGLLLQIPVGK